MSSEQDPPPTRIRGGEAVKTALIDAAAEMLGEIGPSHISVREIAERAGVNHGQVHHYFGGKRPLLEAAMKQLAHGHFEYARMLTGDSIFPPALSLSQDSNYWRAISHIAMDGDLDLARIEIDEGVSVPRLTLKKLRTKTAGEMDDLVVKARLAGVAALQLGWVAFEDYLLMAVDAHEEEDRETLLAEVKKSIENAIVQAFD
ncbi:MAG: TetR family transcriptional regulator [bacterium]|nr:TetR family transcriptional regulator [bacterium]